MRQWTKKYENGTVSADGTRVIGGGDVMVLVSHHGYEFRERVYRYQGQSDADFSHNLQGAKDALRLFALRALAPIEVDRV